MRQLKLQLSKIGGTYINLQHNDAEEQTEVTDTGGDKCFLSCLAGGYLVIVKANKQIRAETYQLPEHIHLEEADGQHQSQHRSYEK